MEVGNSNFRSSFCESCILIELRKAKLPISGIASFACFPVLFRLFFPLVDIHFNNEPGGLSRRQNAKFVSHLEERAFHADAELPDRVFCRWEIARAAKSK